MDQHQFAKNVVRDTAELLKKSQKDTFEVDIKQGNRKDIVTSVDRDIHHFIVSKIKKEFPDHAIYSEEGEDTTQGTFQWVVDPIDGSANFSRGLPHFAICIGLMENGQPILGAILNPITNELFSFRKGAGAFLNDTPVRVSDVQSLNDAFVFLHAGRKEEVASWGGESYRKLLQTARKTGNWSSSSLDICFLAAGRLEAVVYGTLTTLDIASAIGLLQEAGGVFSNAEGSTIAYTKDPQKIYLANSKEMLEQVRTLLEKT